MNTKSILVFADPLFPDFDKFEEEVYLNRVKKYGIEGVEFYFEGGLGIAYNPDILEPGCIINGTQTFYNISSPDKQLVFVYREDMSGLDLFLAQCLTPISATPIATIPLQDYFSEVLC